MAKSLSIIACTLTVLMLVLVSGRYFTGLWLFHTFASFQIQGAAIALLGAIVAFLLHRHLIPALLGIIAIVIGVHGYMMLGDFAQEDDGTIGDLPTAFTLIDMNIMGDNSANGKKIADFVIGSGADVIFLQESAPIGPEIDRIKKIYPYRLGCGAKTITCDQSLWSKRPFVYDEAKTASPIYRDRLMLAGIDFDGQTVNFANVHFTKPYFDGFLSTELGRVKKFISEKNGPLLLAGDFNSSILTPNVRKFIEDTRLVTVGREPHTWPVGLPQIGMAIDHLFVRDGLVIKSLERIEETNGSNHYGLRAEIAFKAK